MTRDQVHDSRGPVKGLFKRADGRYMAGYRQSGRYRMKTLSRTGKEPTTSAARTWTRSPTRSECSRACSPGS